MAEAAGEVGLIQEASRLLERARELQESAASLISTAKKDEQSLCQRAQVLESEFHRLRRSVDAAAKTRAVDAATVDKLEGELYKVKSVVNDGDVSSFLPYKGDGRFLRMFLGPINVRAGRKDVQLKVKEEYNSYRDRTAILFLIFPCMLLFLRNRIWNGCFPALPVQLYQAWLLYLYVSLALRENILRVNGSNIRPWWIYHHYCAMAMALISLTWKIEGEPDCAEKQRGVQLFLAWAIVQAVAMLLQNRYQRQRLYTRIALGKARRMDVVWGETSGVQGQLWLLYPLLFILQIFEAYVGLLLLQIAFSGVVSEWQVVVCGILLVVMAVGNFINTIQTLREKSKVKAKMKRSKSKQEIDQSTSPLELGKTS
ncbi:unnamed protein product [Victoria cruziana]